MDRVLLVFWDDRKVYIALDFAQDVMEEDETLENILVSLTLLIYRVDVWYIEVIFRNLSHKFWIKELLQIFVRYWPQIVFEVHFGNAPI